jgi:SNF2 family DNA or RNA helicase
MKIKSELLPHQKEAVEKLVKLKVGALFMEQGTGKTITTLEIARQRIEKGKIDKVLWLCPCSAKKNIKAEIMKHCSSDMLPYFIICGIETLSTSIRANSYLLNLVDEKRCFLVIDESLLIKNPRALRSEHILAIAEKCQYRIILNGTPISRNEADLFAQFQILDWRILGYRSYWSFAANHIELDDYGRFRRALNTDVISRKISPYVFQVKKKDCMELPEKKSYIEYFDLTEEQDAAYGYAAETLLVEVNEWKPETIYRLFSGLQAVISGKRLIFNERGNHFDTEEIFKNPLDNPRVQMVMHEVDWLNGEKAIIFCHYQSEIEQLCKLIPDSVRFDGTVRMKQRMSNLEEFSDTKNYLIANKACAGYSLNLQFCHNIIYMSNDWDLGTRLQSEDRVHRYGQQENVRITDICADHTIDEQIIRCLRDKEGLLDSVKREIDNSSNVKESLKSIIYGRKKEFFDGTELIEEVK